MSFDLAQVTRYGQKIGAEVAFILDGKCRNYYKKGNAESKWCCLTFTNHHNGRPLRWESANEYSYERIAEFYQGLGHTVELMPIPELQEQEDEQGTENEQGTDIASEA